jgi:ArsR family transcriptional regulator
MNTIDADYTRTASIFKAFCDENRLRILELLQSGEKCACTLLGSLNIGQSTLSHHMKILCDSGIVTYRKEGKWMFYSINEAECQKAQALFVKLTTVSTSHERCVCN